MTWTYSPQQLRRAARAGSGAPSLQTGCVAFWKLGEASGSRVDSTGRGNDLTPQGASLPGNAAGIVGNAVSLVAASTQYLTRVNPADANFGNAPWTASIWVKATTLPTNPGLIVKDTDGSHRDWRLDYDQASNRFRLILFVASGGVAVVASANTFGNVPTATWCHVIAGFDKTNNVGFISVNGGALDTASLGANVPGTSTADLFLGRLGGGYWDGLIDACGLWNRLLTSGEKAALWAAGAGLEWPF